MRSLIEDILKIIDGHYVSYKNNHRVVLAADGIELSIYDKGNLVGFTLSGSVQGKNIYIVHDTDNYNRDDPEHQHLYTEAVVDAKHVVRMFMNHKIRTELVTRKSFLKKKEYLQVIIPDKDGEEISYNCLTVNTTSFYNGSGEW